MKPIKFNRALKVTNNYNNRFFFFNGNFYMVFSAGMNRKPATSGLRNNN